MRTKFITSLLAGTALILGVAVAAAQEHGHGPGGGGGGGGGGGFHPGGGGGVAAPHGGGGFAGPHGGGGFAGPHGGGGFAGPRGGDFARPHGPSMGMQGRSEHVGGLNQPRSFSEGGVQRQHGPGLSSQNMNRRDHLGNRTYGALHENRGRDFANDRQFRRDNFSQQHRFAGHDLKGSDRMRTHGFAQAGVHSRIPLSHTKIDRIRQVALHRNFVSRFRVTNVNFDIAIGVRVPRHFHFFLVPEEIVYVVPAFADDYCFVYEDELVIVDPVTFEIIAIIPV